MLVYQRVDFVFSKKASSVFIETKVFSQDFLEPHPIINYTRGIHTLRCQFQKMCTLQ